MTTTATPPLPDTIRAHVHENAITTVTRFFNATAQDALSELFQNARRAGATQVSVTIADGRVCVTDDGLGIPDPSALLGFGHSNWDDQTSATEDPAGMGFYAIANYPTVSVTSRCQDGVAWVVVLEPEHFLGKREAPVIPMDHAGPVGTKICFDDANANVRDVEAAARYFPLVVTCNGEAVKQADFLENAFYRESWRGLTIGVTRTAHYAIGNRKGYQEINFHGVTARGAKLPTVACIDGLPWLALVDVQNCPDLALTLPARHELVQNQFLEELRQAARSAIYRAIAASEDPPDLPYQEFQRARNMGIPVPPARQLLRSWEAEQYSWVYYGKDITATKAEPPSDAVLLDHQLAATPDQQMLAWAAQRSGLSDRLWEANPELVGYDWYDRLAKATGLHVVIRAQSDTETLIGTDGSRYTLEASRPDSIALTLWSDGPHGPAALEMSTDVAFGTDSAYLTDQPNLIVTKDSDIAVSELVELVTNAFFCPSDDLDADSPETQEEEWYDRCHELAIKTLHSDEQAMSAAIEMAVMRHVRYHLRKGYAANISINEARQVSVSLTKTEDAE